MTHPCYSMTGFGGGERTSDAARVAVELRSVNHRSLGG